MKTNPVARGMINTAYIIAPDLTILFEAMFIEIKAMIKSDETSEIEVIASLQISSRRCCAVSGMSTIFWNGSN